MSCQCTSVKHGFKFLLMSKLYKLVQNLYKLLPSFFDGTSHKGRGGNIFLKAKADQNMQKNRISKDHLRNLISVLKSGYLKASILP